MTEKTKRKLKKAAGIAGVALGIVSAAVVGYVFLNKPAEVKNPCWRSTHRADGIAKVPFKTAKQANLQSVKQLVRYGEVCHPYKCNDSYFTGHSKNGIQSINPKKMFKKRA